VALLLTLLSCAYGLLFIPPNLTGAADPEMLSVFKIDEYAQFPVVIRMTTPDRSLAETAQHAFVYYHYYYGYPFYLLSALAILPLRCAFHFFPATATFNPTTAYMLILRQLSPLFMVLAINILVYLWTGFRRAGPSTLLFLFLATIPAVFENNMWWHPDSLLFASIVLTIFSLSRDELRYGKWFAWANVLCGLAIGTKLTGLWLLPAIALYLALGLAKAGIYASLRRAGIGLMLMAVTVLISNPLLLNRHFARIIVDTQIEQARMNGFGWATLMSKGFVAWYTETVRGGFGPWWIHSLALGTCLCGIAYDRRRRLLHLLVLAWVLPLAMYLGLFVANKAARYALPAMVPMMSCIGSLLIIRPDRLRSLRSAAAVAVIVVLVGQIGRNLQLDLANYVSTLRREDTSSALQFSRRLESRFRATLRKKAAVTVFRDPYVYCPPRRGIDVRMKWGSADYHDIEALGADFILLQDEYIRRYSDASIIEVSYDRGQALRSHEFYGDANRNAIRGFHRILATEFGAAFERDP
jgi:hypothetical protein